MKLALYYSIRVATLYPYVVAVTSEKKGSYGRMRWYGRRCQYDEATNGTASDLRGKFDTQEQAEALCKKVGELHKAYQDASSLAYDLTQKLCKQQADGLTALFNGKEPGPVPVIVQVEKRWIASSNAEWMANGVRGGAHMGDAAMRATEFLDPRAGGVIFVLPDRTKDKSYGRE